MKPGTIDFQRALKTAHPMLPGERREQYLDRVRSLVNAQGFKITRSRMNDYWYGHAHYAVDFRDAAEQDAFLSPVTPTQAADDPATRIAELTARSAQHSHDIDRLKKDLADDIIREFAQRLLGTVQSPSR